MKKYKGMFYAIEKFKFGYCANVYNQGGRRMATDHNNWGGFDTVKSATQAAKDLICQFAT